MEKVEKHLQKAGRFLSIASVFIEIMVIYPIFIGLFYFTHQSIVLSTKVPFHFHLYDYYMYKSAFWMHNH